MGSAWSCFRRREGPLGHGQSKGRWRGLKRHRCFREFYRDIWSQSVTPPDALEQIESGWWRVKKRFQGSRIDVGSPCLFIIRGGLPSSLGGRHPSSPRGGGTGVRAQEGTSQNHVQASHTIITSSVWWWPHPGQPPGDAGCYKAWLSIFWWLKTLGGRRKEIMLQITQFLLIL